MHDENCIFCKIAAGEIPASKVYEDDYVVAFDDLEPVMPVHTLIIPKSHYSNVGDNVPEELLGKVFGAAGKVAEIKGLTNGYRLMVNTGADAGQTVHHLHVHVLGGHRMPDPNKKDWAKAAK